MYPCRGGSWCDKLRASRSTFECTLSSRQRAGGEEVVAEDVAEDVAELILADGNGMATALAMGTAAKED
jgi:hypothetical protein